MRNFITCTLPRYNENDQVKKNEMGRAYCTHEEKNAKQGFGGEIGRKETARKT
jgi:hypothetical protein